MENPLELEHEEAPLVDDRLADLTAGLPDAPGVEPTPTEPAPAPDYVTRAQYDALNNQFASLGPIAEELRRNPAAAEQIRRQLIIGDVAVPGSRQAAAPAPYQAPAPQITPEILDRFRQAMLDNPMAFTEAVANAKANQIVNERLAPLLAQGAQTQAQLFANNKATANPDDYAMTAPYFNAAVQSVNLAAIPPESLGGFLEITYRAARGDAYAAANEPAAAAPQYAAPTPHLQAVPPRQAPPYGGASGAVGSSATRPLVQRARASAQQTPAEVVALAKRSGLTKQDFEKYGADVQDQLG